MGGEGECPEFSSCVFGLGHVLFLAAAYKFTTWLGERHRLSDGDVSYMGRGPVLREVQLILRYITVSYTISVLCVWDVIRMTRAIHYSLVDFLCNSISVLCVWDVIL